jgi:hypothetical protein
MPTSPRKTAATKPQAAKKPSAISDWKKTPDPIELPSGKWMTVRHTSLSVFIQTGQIPNSLMSVVQGQVNSKKKKSDEDLMEEITEDPKAIQDLFAVVDKYVCMVAIEPEVNPMPQDEADRDPNLLYVDEMDASDKMYLFQRAVGGTTDLETFRHELNAGMDLVQQREDVVVPPKRSPRSRRPVQ